MRNLLMHLFVWLGGKLFKYLDIYSPDQEDVTGVTFSNDEEYIEAISKIERG